MPPSSLPSSANPAPAPYVPSGRIRPVDPALLGLFEHDEDEQLIGQINRHPIGLVLIWFTALLIFIVVLVVGYVVLKYAPSAGVNTDSFRTFATITLGALAFFVLVAGYIAAWVYQRSVVIITSEKIIQLLQRNILDRKISQLSIGDIQDVTVSQRGLLSRMFDFGTLIVETAGEQSNYTFDYVPFPYDCSKEIVGAHERNLKLYGN